MNHLFRALPSMDASLDALLAADKALHDLPRPLLREAVTDFWNSRRDDIRAGRVQDAAELALEACLPELLAFVRRTTAPRLRNVINGTGVVIHTNMGRSVLARSAQEAVRRVISGYCNLELDLHSGGRGSRYAIIDGLLQRLTGAEAGMVVNNNAAAVLLLLDTFCKGGEVIVSRGELVEIGGSFRIPEVMEKSGARLREVGATNRCHLRDYAAAINETTRALMRVHTSNYRIVGFHSAVPLPELAALAREHGLPVIEDLGSGSFMDFSAVGLPNEPTVPEVVAGGADVVTFSGDKVLGGPQCGLIVGSRERIEALKKNPLTRALRCDKLTMAALEATLRLYCPPRDTDPARHLPGSRGAGPRCPLAGRPPAPRPGPRLPCQPAPRCLPRGRRRLPGTRPAHHPGLPGARRHERHGPQAGPAGDHAAGAGPSGRKELLP